MIIGRSYKANYTMSYVLKEPRDASEEEGLLTASLNPLLAGTIHRNMSFLVVDSCENKGTNKNLIWYKLLAPDVLGWIAMKRASSERLQKHGIVHLDFDEDCIEELGREDVAK